MATERKGIPASPGVAVGPAYIHHMIEVDIPQELIAPETIAFEEKRFLDGREQAAKQLEEIMSKASANLSEEELEVFEGHIEILMDEDLKDEIIDRIKTSRYDALRAISEVIDENIAEMKALDDDYMRERAADINDIGKRLLFAVAGRPMEGLDLIATPSVVIANDLTPSETAVMERKNVLAFITEVGGKSSHVAIMAKSLEIPAIVGAGEILDMIKNGDRIAVDALKGVFIVNPDQACQNDFAQRIKAWKTQQKELEAMRDLPAETTDGHRVEICANIGTEADVEGALRHGAEGIGLFRTEFVFMERDSLPDEDEQFQAYRKVVKQMHPRPVIIRTMDIGGDKGLDYLDIPPEQNPFLGWRALRICLDRPAMFKVQLKAILRTAKYGDVRVMFPMIDSLSQVIRAKTLLNEAAQELKAKGIPYKEPVEVGIMIETPSAAVIAKHLIREVDFFSIGTNDLTQYTLAVDRGNTMIASLYQPMHPAVLSLIKNIIDASHDAGKWTGMCGELASNEFAALILVGMGLDELSMSAVDIGKVKKYIRKHSLSELKNMADRVLSEGTVDGIMDIVNHNKLEFC